jgi:hypothetical protein
MFKVQVLFKCSHCDGQAYLPIGEAEDCEGNKYIQHAPCPTCNGSGNEPKWVSLEDFAKLLQQVRCPHKHSSLYGSMRYVSGDVWDDLIEVCDDCGANLDKP